MYSTFKKTSLLMTFFCFLPIQLFQMQINDERKGEKEKEREKKKIATFSRP